MTSASAAETCSKKPACEYVRVRVTSANVRSLHPRGDACSYRAVQGRELRGKVEILQNLFHERGVDVVGIQEGRAGSTDKTVCKAHTTSCTPVRLRMGHMDAKFG